MASQVRDSASRRCDMPSPELTPAKQAQDDDLDRVAPETPPEAAAGAGQPEPEDIHLWHTSTGRNGAASSATVTRNQVQQCAGCHRVSQNADCKESSPVKIRVRGMRQSPSDGKRKPAGDFSLMWIVAMRPSTGMLNSSKRRVVEDPLDTRLCVHGRSSRTNP
jgi:hypothetical protein